MRLSELKIGEKGLISKVLGHGAFRKRVMEMGIVRGKIIKPVYAAPLGDPITYTIMGYNISLRKSEASQIEVILVKDEQEAEAILKKISDRSEAPKDYLEKQEKISDELEAKVRQGKTITVALIGNPNCGKTSLFNIASGARERVGNYSGVTVDAKTGYFEHGGYKFDIVDLPGTYSLTSYSPEELYVRQYLKDNSPDVILNVVDVSNLERNLYLTTELIDMDRSMVIALNMYDELRTQGIKLDFEQLGGMLGVPMEPIVAKTGEGVEHLFDEIIRVFKGEDPTVRHIHVWLGQDIEAAVRKIVDLIKADNSTEKHFSPRYIAIKLLEDDEAAKKVVSKFSNGKKILLTADEQRGRIESLSDDDIGSMVAASKYGFIAGALAETMTVPKNKKKNKSNLIDSLVTNKWLGFPLFFLIMFFIFWATFFLGQYPMDWIETGVSWLSMAMNDLLPEGFLKDLISDGIIGGVGGVIVFLPQILILYFCISWMEDSGYMARAAFIMDKVMHRIGLHGKSFIPLVMGFGCNVPSVLACRAIESKSSRIITILINPFMSCSARVPIFVLLVGTFFPDHAALMFMGLYVLGVLMAVITAKLLRKFLFKKDETPFVMELPPYRIPTMKSSLRHTWGKGEQYLKKMGGTILIASVVVWALNYFPIHHVTDSAPKTESIAVNSGATAGDSTAVEVYDDSKPDMSKDSYLKMLGKAVNPVMEPLGFNWKGTVAAIAGVPAKEIVVSTLGVLYTGDEAASDATLSERLISSKNVAGKPDFDAASALSFMVFILLYCPCVATITAIVKETHSWKYGLFSIVYNTLLAWIVAFCVYRIALLL